MKHLTLNRVFAAYLVFFVLLLAGIVPRSTVLYVTAFLLAWSMLATLENATLFFIRSIPLFVAIPLTATYDNLTMWRPLALVLIARLVVQRETRQELLAQWRNFRAGAAAWIKKHSVLRRLSIILAFAVLSLIHAGHPITGAVRIIYFVNLSMVPVVIYALLKRGTLTGKDIIHNLAIPTMIVIMVGFIQLASTYLVDIYGFMRLWGEGIQLRQYGQEWSHIAVWVGNTWLAYYGPQLSLRVFSLFTDSHSFPTFLLLGIPTLFALALKPVLAVADTSWWQMVRNRAKIGIVWVPLAMLAAILSGTRGIWAAFVGAAILVPCLLWLFRRLHVDTLHRRVFAYVHTYLVVFLMLFAIAWPIFISPQFLIGKADLGLFGSRIRSIVDFGETSNALRLKIWKASLVSIKNHPLLGVGIGNFPVVLDEDIALSRAGSSAHNLYLHVAAEMGIIAGLEMIILLAAAWWSIVKWFRVAQGPELAYTAALLIYLPWVLAYVLTDPIIFDERIFLMLATTLVLVWSHE